MRPWNWWSSFCSKTEKSGKTQITKIDASILDHKEYRFSPSSKEVILDDAVSSKFDHKTLSQGFETTMHWTDFVANVSVFGLRVDHQPWMCNWRSAKHYRRLLLYLGQGAVRLRIDDQINLLCSWRNGPFVRKKAPKTHWELPDAANPPVLIFDKKITAKRKQQRGQKL